VPGQHLGQVRIRETNNPEPSLTRRKPGIAVKTRSERWLWDKSIGNLITEMDGSRREGGVNLIWALVRNCGNQLS